MRPHFTQECPVCGRPLSISAAHAGHHVTCCHCRGRFVAIASSMNGNPLAAQENSLLCRADQLLEMVGRRFAAIGAPVASTARPAYPCEQLV